VTLNTLSPALCSFPNPQ